MELIDFGMAVELERPSIVGIHEKDTKARAADAVDTGPRKVSSNKSDNAPQRGVPLDIALQRRQQARIQATRTMRHLGTTAYAAREMLLGQKVGTPADMWSLGVIMYVLLSGTHPFDPENIASDSEIEQAILSHDFDFSGDCWAEVSPSAIELIQLLLHEEPSLRPTAEEALNHPWLTDGPAAERLSNEPLIEVADRLRKYHNGRRWLRASILAVLFGMSEGKR